MNYHLSTNVIRDTIHALAALQTLACGDDSKAILAPVLCRQRNEVIAVMIRNAFVEVVMRLGPLVADMSLDEKAAPDAESFLSVELITPVGFSTTRHGVVRRALEQTVALTALHMWCLASEHEGSEAVASLAANFAAVAESWYSTLATSLTPAIYPTIRK